MEYYGKILCISAQDLTYDDRPVVGGRALTELADGSKAEMGVKVDWSHSRVLNGRRPQDVPLKILAPIVSAANYKNLLRRGQINVVRRGGGVGTYALVEVATLPLRFREAIKEKYGDMEQNVLKDWFGQHYRLDAKAREFYTRFRFGDGGTLPPEKINEYTVNASVLQAVVAVVSDTNIMRRAMHGPAVNWGEVVGVISFYQAETGHTLPKSAHRFRDTVKQFQADGYETLISKKFRNQNTRKVTMAITRLVLSLDCQPDGTRPFNTVVAEAYNQFVNGEITVADPVTGEIFDPRTFVDKKGNPMVLSSGTISNILNSAEHKALRAKYHDTQWTFNQTYRPHHLRHAPFFAMSKISADDRDLPWLLKDSERVHGYFIYDVLSGCVIGRAYARKKEPSLYVDCVRNMFQLLIREGWNMPGEIEVEHHLVELFKDSWMKAQVLFPLVRWCNPGNSQEKHAEHNNRDFRYGVEKRNVANAGRWYARLEANRTKEEKVYDETNAKWKHKVYTWDEVLAMNSRHIEEYNHELHPDQKRFKGMTRWDVLSMMQNPDLRPFEKWYLYRYIGEKTSTTIRRNMYCTVMYNQYVLPDPHVIRRLQPGNMKVDAYWLAESDGSIGEVYLWQGGEYLCTCKKADRYNTAKTEWEEADKAAYEEQSKYVSRFDKMMKDGKIQPVVIVRQEEKEAIEVAAADAKPCGEPQGTVADDEDFSEYMDAGRYAQMGVAGV